MRVLKRPITVEMFSCIYHTPPNTLHKRTTSKPGQSERSTLRIIIDLSVNAPITYHLNSRI